MFLLTLAIHGTKQQMQLHGLRFLSGSRVQPIEVLIHPLGGEHSMMAWLWLLEYAEHGHPAFPAVHDGIMNVNVSTVLQSQPTPEEHPFQASHVQQPAASQEISFTLTCATANVLTLYQNKHEHGKGLTARLEALLRSFDHENILVIGAQETRSQMQGHTMCHDFHVLAAPATPKGVGGVQLWIKRKWKTSQGTITISTADLRIVAADPQFLLVKLMHDGLRLLFLVGHAPNCPTFEAATTFWNKISRSIPASLRSWALIGLLDANARVGSMQSKAIGNLWRRTRKSCWRMLSSMAPRSKPVSATNVWGISLWWSCDMDA